MLYYRPPQTAGGVGTELYDPFQSTQAPHKTGSTPAKPNTWSAKDDWGKKPTSTATTKPVTASKGKVSLSTKLTSCVSKKNFASLFYLVLL